MMLRGLGVLAAVVLAMTAGCGDDDPEPAPQSSVSATPSTPAEALELGGLELPAAATSTSVRPVEETPYLEVWLVRFEQPRDAALAFCDTGEMGGDLPAVRLTEEDRQVFDVPEGEELDDDARICGSQLPSDVAWERRVLVTGDPATIAVAITRAGR